MIAPLVHLGTSRHNSREMVLRGRYRGPAKLSPAQRAEVVAAVGNGASQRAVGARFGVSQATVSNIMRGKHTALGDARWARSIYDKVTGGDGWAADVKVSSKCNDCPWELTTGSLSESEEAWLRHRERWCPRGSAAIEAARRAAEEAIK